jgi:hypothetical protein
MGIGVFGPSSTPLLARPVPRFHNVKIVNADNEDESA